jgi:Leucine-rich repeat (LRR) protein
MEIPQLPEFPPQQIINIKKPIISGKLDLINEDFTDLAQYLAQYTPAELKRVLHLNISYCKLPKIEITNLPKLRTLTCYGTETTEIIISAPQLFKINCHDNKITSLGRINAPLRELNCSFNKIKTFADFSMVTLEILNCNYNSCETLDLTAPNLREINCCNNLLTSIISNMPNIRSVYANNNQIESLDGTSYLNLTELHLDNNKLTKISGDFPNLKKIECSKNKISTLADINYPVEELIIDQNLLLSLDSLNDNPILSASIKILNCEQNKLTKLKLNAPNLTNLCISHNDINIIDENLIAPNLLSLDCYYNDLTKLKIISPTINSINCNHNRLTAIELDTPQLTQLTCYENHIESFDNMNMPNIVGLFAQANEIKHFSRELFNAQNLMNLNISNNKLTDLTGVYMPKLIFINCSHNNLSSFDFSDINGNNFGALYQIHCQEHELTTLTHLLNMPKLKYINIHANDQLTPQYIKVFKSNYYKRHKRRLNIVN